MTFLQRLRFAFRAARVLRFVDDETLGDWSEQDQDIVGRFFGYGSGRKLMLRLENGVINMALQAVQKGDARSCGVADGMQLQLVAIRNHFPPAQSASEQSEESEQEASLEHFADSTA